MRRQLIGFLLVLVFSFTGAALVFADSGEVPLEEQPALPVGTVITTQNWQQYKDYMPFWMQVVFSGQYAYKLAPNQEVVVGPPTIKALPKEYEKNTEKYSGQVGLKVLPDGGTVIQNYTAGLPFSHPTNPDIGDKILWDLWYRYVPRVEINKLVSTHLIDKYHQVFTETIFLDYQRLGHVSEPGMPTYIPEGKDIDFTLYVELTEPEESKYTVSLTIYFLDPTRVQEFWSFVPSLRRPLRLSASARCAPVVGSDSTNEDAKSGFNGLLSEMYVDLVAHKKTLMMNSVQPAYPAQISFLDPNTFHLWGADTGVMWPPAPSKWDLAETWVVDAKRVRDKLAGYCYGNRRMYIDAQDYHISGEDINDMSGKLWKLIMLFARLHPNGFGDMYESGTGNWSFATIDLQNVHQSVTSEFYSNLANTDVEPDLWSVSRYASPTGLLEIMK